MHTNCGENNDKSISFNKKYDHQKSPENYKYVCKGNSAFVIWFV